MTSDLPTLLQATTGICLFAALAFWGGARLLGMSPRALRAWAVANLAFGAGTMLTVLRAGSTSPWLYALADALELLGFASLYAGLRRFLRRDRIWREPAAAAGGAQLAIAFAYASGQPVLRLAAYCLGAAWLLARTGRAALRGGGAGFGFAAGLLIATLMFAAAALQLLRAATGTYFGDAGRIGPLSATA